MIHESILPSNVIKTGDFYLSFTLLALHILILREDYLGSTGLLLEILFLNCTCSMKSEALILMDAGDAGHTRVVHLNFDEHAETCNLILDYQCVFRAFHPWLY